jgi:tetratricopeptide (TPR) repeat protein
LMFKESHELESRLENQAGVANALSDLAIIAHVNGDLDQAIALQTNSLSIQRGLANDNSLPNEQRSWHERQVAVLLNNMGSARAAQERYDEAEALLNESVEQFQKLEDLRDCAFALDHLANVAIYQRYYPEARISADESLLLRRKLSDTKGVADTLRTLGRLQIETRQYADAKKELHESLLKSRSVSDKNGIVECLGLFASLATQSGDFLRGILLYAAAEREWENSRLSKSWHNTHWRKRDLDAARAYLEDSQFNTVWQEGSKVPLAKAIEVAAQIDVGASG